tara:strand:- start:112 stop:522 length:411 start_codon:yes stop_codon:yes gene_type:complete
MRQINFGLIFSFGLITVFFTLANTNATTVHVLPGMEYTLPLAGLLLLVAGVGAIAAWFFAAWTGMLNNVEQFSKANEFEAQQVRIQELETDLNRYRSTVETQLGLLPATTVSASSAESEDGDESDDTDITDTSSAA